jgi:hypothetical protein
MMSLAKMVKNFWAPKKGGKLVENPRDLQLHNNNSLPRICETVNGNVYNN